MLRVHLLPAPGTKRLDAITTEDVQQLKRQLSGKKPKTVNNVLTVLNTLLKKAVEWGLLDRLSCTIRLLKVTPGSFDFFDFDEYERLVAAAKAIDTAAYVAVLLAGDGGLRAGEIRVLSWGDVNFEKRLLRVERSEWRGHITTPKGGRLRYQPMTRRLADALRTHRHLRGKRVLTRPDGSQMTAAALQELFFRAERRRANLRERGPHTLKHTFLSHLAMRGAAPRAIQDLGGHRDLATTMRYLHLSPGATRSAIELLEQPAPGTTIGDITETGSAAKTKVNG